MYCLAHHYCECQKCLFLEIITLWGIPFKLLSMSHHRSNDVGCVAQRVYGVRCNDYIIAAPPSGYRYSVSRATPQTAWWQLQYIPYTSGQGYDGTLITRLHLQHLLKHCCGNYKILFYAPPTPGEKIRFRPNPSS
jgi:hypothetical protein